MHLMGLDAYCPFVTIPVPITLRRKAGYDLRSTPFEFHRRFSLESLQLRYATPLSFVSTQTRLWCLATIFSFVGSPCLRVKFFSLLTSESLGHAGETEICPGCC